MGKSKVIRCLRYLNMGQMHVRLNGKLVEAVDCFKYLGLQMSLDGGCERDVINTMNKYKL